MTTATASTYVPDALASLRDSFALHVSATRQPKTAVIYTAALDNLIAHLEAHGMPTAARSVRREHVESYLAARRLKVKPATLSIEFRALNVFFKWAIEEDEIERSPMEKIKAPTVPVVPVDVVEMADFKLLLKQTAGNGFIARRDTAILLLFLDTGIRLGELTGLGVEDVDLQARQALVTGSKSKDVRVVRFGAKTAVAIDRYLRLRRGHRRADDPRLWLGQDGPMTGSGIAQMIAKRCAAAGLPRLHPHQFRHTFASEYLEAGGQEGDLQVLAGWKSRQMLSRYGQATAGRRAREHYTSPVDRL